MQIFGENMPLWGQRVQKVIPQLALSDKDFVVPKKKIQRIFLHGFRFVVERIEN